MFGRRKSKQPEIATARLMVIKPRAGEPLELRVLKPTVSIGSGQDNDFVVREPTVSEHHAMLVQKDGHFELSDLVSSNGTFVNGRRVHNRRAVKFGDELLFGGARFVLANPVVIGDAVDAVPERQTRRKIFSSRAAFELAILMLAIGFGSAQYLAYLLYHEQNRLILAEAVPLPPSRIHQGPRTQSIERSTAPIAPPIAIAKRGETAATLPRARPETSRASGTASPTAELPSRPVLALADRGSGNDELAGALSLMRMFPGSATHAGEPAGGFDLTDLGGAPVSLSAMRGKVVLLTFWATWCGACRGELPKLQSLYRNLKSRNDFTVLTINIDQRSESVLPFVRKNDYEFPVLLDADNRVSGAYDVRGIPANFIIDRKGKIVWDCAGSIDWSNRSLREAVEKLL
jgi:peroxiredoxin